ncbi:MAG: hypothetical protein Q8P67_13055, partial [archaeon]|nr:hypothetical protein [archaeon]
GSSDDLAEAATADAAADDGAVNDAIVGSATEVPQEAATADPATAEPIDADALLLDSEASSDEAETFQIVAPSAPISRSLFGGSDEDLSPRRTPDKKPTISLSLFDDLIEEAQSGLPSPSPAKVSTASLFDDDDELLLGPAAAPPKPSPQPRAVPGLFDDENEDDFFKSPLKSPYKVPAVAPPSPLFDEDDIFGSKPSPSKPQSSLFSGEVSQNTMDPLDDSLWI